MNPREGLFGVCRFSVFCLTKAVSQTLLICRSSRMLVKYFSNLCMGEVTAFTIGLNGMSGLWIFAVAYEILLSFLEPHRYSPVSFFYILRWFLGLIFHWVSPNMAIYMIEYGV